MTVNKEYQKRRRKGTSSKNTSSIGILSDFQRDLYMSDQNEGFPRSKFSPRVNNRFCKLMSGGKKQQRKKGKLRK